MAEVKIHFICQIKNNDNPRRQLAAEITGRLIEPAIPAGLDFDLQHGDFRAEPGSLDHYTIDMMAWDQLVIVDLTDLSETAYFLIGARAHKGLPIVYIYDEAYAVPYDLRSDLLVRYSIDRLPESVMHLREEIERALAEKSPASLSPKVSIPPLPPRELRLELANRIEATADLIRLLRINSVSQGVDELVAIAAELRALPDESSPSRLQDAGDKALNVVSAIFDELSSQPGARMAISGALALIIGGTGVSGVAAFSAGLAFWYGKDAYKTWMTAWGKRHTRTARRKKK